jgi:PadR family transcriptional regulator PadR
MPNLPPSPLYGNLNLLILHALRTGPRHGLAVARVIRELSEEELRIEEGALYPALHRLEREGYLKGGWGASENNRRAKYYQLTAAGRRLLARELDTWQRHTRAVAKVLEALEAEG